MRKSVRGSGVPGFRGGVEEGDRELKVECSTVRVEEGVHDRTTFRECRGGGGGRGGRVELDECVHGGEAPGRPDSGIVPFIMRFFLGWSMVARKLSAIRAGPPASGTLERPEVQTP